MLLVRVCTGLEAPIINGLKAGQTEVLLILQDKALAAALAYGNDLFGLCRTFSFQSIRAMDALPSQGDDPCAGYVTALHEPGMEKRI
ncbi:Uncharacterised protein [uncultured archaeon]|nr:Uncharacterised protein [uncultured archaeon]